MKRILLISSLILSAFALSRCDNNYEIPEIFVNDVIADYPTADFEYTISPTDSRKVSFASKSAKYTSLYWQLGDDSLSTDSVFEHVYERYGRFKVILTARNDKGYASRKEVSIYLKNPAFNPDSIGENYVLTKGGELSVFRENGSGANGGEGSRKLIDGNRFNKFFVAYDANVGTWWQFRFLDPIVIKAYSMTSGDDSPGRDPKDWTLEGSNDGENWTVLDQKVGYLWPPDAVNNVGLRNKTVIFHITANELAFSYYRLNITKINGATGIQLSEWTLNASQP